MTAPADEPSLPFEDAAAWGRWLEANADATGLWLLIARKGSGVASVSYSEAVDVALCHGWIDGSKRSVDARFYGQRFSPRGPRSLWSKINIGRAERLLAAGRMRPGGLREIEKARADGRWEAAYAGSATMDVPEELARALAGNRRAAASFDNLDRANRYAFCWRVRTAKKPETRQARAEKFVAMLARGEKLH